MIIREENKERLSDQNFLRGVWLLTFLVVTFQSLNDENDNLSFEALCLTFAIFSCLTTVKAIVCLLLQKKGKKKNMDWLADRNTSQYNSKLLGITVEYQLKSAVCAFLFQVEYINTVIKDNHWALR